MIAKHELADLDPATRVGLAELGWTRARVDEHVQTVQAWTETVDRGDGSWFVVGAGGGEWIAAKAVVDLEDLEGPPEDDGRRCPTCRKPIAAVVQRGPDVARAHPCRHRVAPDLLRRPDDESETGQATCDTFQWSQPASDAERDPE